MKKKGVLEQNFYDKQEQVGARKYKLTGFFRLPLLPWILTIH